MSKTHHSKPRQTRKPPAHSGPTQNPQTARYAVGYRPVLGNLVSTRPQTQARPKPGSRLAPRLSKKARKTPPTRTATRSDPVYTFQKLKDLFGAWEATTPPARVKEALQRAKNPLADAVHCVKSKVKRQILFATRSTGKGSHSPKLHYSNRNCK